MLATLRRPVLTRTLTTSLLAVSAAGFPSAVAERAVAKTAPPVTRVVPGTVLHPKPPTYVRPVSRYRLTGRFGARSGYWSTVHTGLDFAAPTGTPIRSISAGVVSSTGYDGRYGTKTVVTLKNGSEIWYCHQDSTAVTVGQRVRAGEVIGAVGTTGNVTGSHLHLEVRTASGRPVDPLAWMRAQGIAV